MEGPERSEGKTAKGGEDDDERGRRRTSEGREIEGRRGGKRWERKVSFESSEGRETGSDDDEERKLTRRIQTSQP